MERWIMLQVYKELKQKLEEKAERKKQLLAELDVAYEGIQEAYDAEREKIFRWMSENEFSEHEDDLGKIEFRTSSPKYVIVDGKEEELIKYLADNDYTDALQIKKQPVNDLKKAGLIDDELVAIKTEPELAITIFKGDE